MAEDTWDVHGVTVTQKRLTSGPIWRWDIQGFGDLVLHHEIQWVQSSGRWVRRTSVSEGLKDGGWNAYPANYRRVTDEDDAVAVVREQLEHELAPGGADYQ